MNLRAAVSTLAFVASLAEVAAAAAWLSSAMETLPSPGGNLPATHVPAFTRAIVDAAPAFPSYLVACGVLTTAGALYLWRSSRPADSKTFWISILALVNMFVAGQLSMSFFVGYVLLPKAKSLAF